MTASSPAALPAAVPSFFRSSVGRGFYIFAICCALMSAAIGVGSYSLSLHWFVANKGEEKVTAAQLVDAFVTVYTAARGKFMTQYAPVPSSFRAQAIDRFNQQRGSDSAMRLLWVGPPNREIVTAPSDDQMSAVITSFVGQPQPQPVTRFLTVNDTLTFRTMFPVMASQQGCVDCHNQIQAGPIQAAQQPAWHVGDVMGAAVLDVPASPFLRQSKIESMMIGFAVFCLSTGIGLVTFRLQYKEFARRAASEASLLVAKEAAEEANRAKSVFLATMSHELRTPLNAIIGFSEVLTSKTLGRLSVDQMQAYAGDIHDSGIHLLDVINDILDLSKAEAGKLDLRDEVLELEPLVDSVLRTMQPHAQTGEITLSAKLAADLPRLYADERILRQIMLNLLSNAVKFTPPGGQVEIEAARHAEGGLSIGVRDTGIGMAEADIPKALEPFQQIDNKLSRKFQGTGLGLPLVKAMIGAHGGSLHIVSAPGVGTTVTVTLPVERIVSAKSTRENTPARNSAAA